MAEKIFTESPYVIPGTAKEIKNFIKEIPGSPGVYKFLDVFKLSNKELKSNNLNIIKKASFKFSVLKKIKPSNCWEENAKYYE